MTEEWKAIVGWEGFYEVSNLGRVRSLDRVVTQRGKGGVWRDQKYAGRVLRPGLDSYGYEQVTLRAEGQSVRPLVHHLVLAAFGPPRPDGWTADHKNGKRTDNRISNLRWFLARDQGRNRHHVRNRTGFIGVTANPGQGQPFWASARNRDGKKVFLGMHQTPEEAHAAYMDYRETQFTHA